MCGALEANEIEIFQKEEGNQPYHTDSENGPIK